MVTRIYHIADLFCSLLEASPSEEFLLSQRDESKDMMQMTSPWTQAEKGVRPS